MRWKWVTVFCSGGSGREQHCSNSDDLSLEKKTTHKPEGHFDKLKQFSMYGMTFMENMTKQCVSQ